jgi:hypothetical protein
MRLALQATAIHDAGGCKCWISGGNTRTDGQSRGVVGYVQGAAFPGTLGELVNRLKAWRATLQATVEAATPGPLRLEQLSRKLQVPRCAAEGTCQTSL